MTGTAEADERHDAGGALHAENGVVALTGDWTVDTARSLDDQLNDLDLGHADSVTLDGSGIRRLDTAGGYLIYAARERLAGRGEVRLEGFSGPHAELMDALFKAPPEELPPPPERNALFDFLYDIGKGASRIAEDVLGILNVLGEVAVAIAATLVGRRTMRWAALVNQIDRAGFQAVPIIALMSFLIGMIVAQQGGFYLRTYGADIFVVDLVGVLVCREMGVLITAIMVAGRSGSAITAEIGSMKMREEVDALTVLGVSPVDVLVLPRVLALIIVLPILTLVSDLAALAGAWVMALFDLGIPTTTFLSRLREALSTTYVLIGLSKAPVMALIICMVACVEGFKVSGSAESLGAHTTASVVKAIFLVVVVDGVFAILFATLGV